MSFLLDLEDVPETALVAEIERRRKARASGFCDYCGRPGTDPPCKHVPRHQVSEVLALSQPHEVYTSHMGVLSCCKCMRLFSPGSCFRRTETGAEHAFGCYLNAIEPITVEAGGLPGKSIDCATCGATILAGDQVWLAGNRVHHHKCPSPFGG